MEFQAIVNNLPFLLTGLLTTIVVGVSSLVIALIGGATLALGRLSGISPVSHLASLYIDVIRGTPLYIQLVWAFFVLPILTGISLSALATGVIGLGAYSAAYFAEVFRTGILAVPRGQHEAAMAQGMTLWQRSHRIIMPQAVRITLPPATNTLVNHIKDTSLVSVIGLADLMYQGYSLSALTFRPFEVLTLVAAIYFVVCYPTTVLANRMHRAAMRAA